MHPTLAVEEHMSHLDRAAVVVNDKVGTSGFFVIILVWTVIWTGYNILATKLHWLHWHPFDRFPAFAAYLLMSNVIQILLMPLILVGQNLQSRHSEARAEADLYVDQQSFKHIETILERLERQEQAITALLQTNTEILTRLAENQERIATEAGVNTHHPSHPE